MKEKLIAIIFVIVAALINFSCGADLEIQDPVISVVPGGVPGDWHDCSGKLGTHACNFVLKDQYGQDWQLYEHHGDIVVLDFSTMWCGVCMSAATHVQDFQDQYGPNNVVWVTVLLQDFVGMLPIVDHAVMWAEAFNISTAPVLIADESIFDMVLADGYNISVLPTIVLIDREMINAYIMEGWNNMRLIDQIEQLMVEM